jgi:hypothetical protein
MKNIVINFKCRAIDQAWVLLQALQSIWDLWWKNVALGEVFLRVLRLSPVSINTPHSFIHLSLILFVPIQ